MSAGTTNSIQFHSRASVVAQPVTHSALAFFEKPSVLINCEGSHDQEVYPQVGCPEPQLDFIVTSDNRNLVDFNKIFFDIDCAIYKTAGILVSSSNNGYHIKATSTKLTKTQRKS